MVKLRKIGCTRRYRRRADGFVAELDRDTAGQSNEPSMHSSTSSGLPWIVLSVGWLAMVAWVAIVEPTDDAAPRAYAMTAVVPLASLLVIGVALT
jgi:hypothetical protein